MFAVIKTGGKQYKVAADDEITVMLLEGDVGASVTFDEVLSYGDGAAIEIGTPLISGATVEGEIVQQKRGPKVIAFKKRRRKNSRRKRGHRQDLTVVRITDILAVGQERRRHLSGDAEAVLDAPEAPVVEAQPAIAIDDELVDA
jgi:large subunit ribosomal protein L21